MNQPRPFRKPPDVEEALSSMLWTPYDNNGSDTDSSQDEEPCSLTDPTIAVGRYSNNNHLIQSTRTMKRSFSEWNYHSSSDSVQPVKAPLFLAAANAIGSGEPGSRYSYPYYSLHPAVSGVGADCYWNSNNIYTNGYPNPALATPSVPSGTALDYYWKQLRPTVSATMFANPGAAVSAPSAATTLLPFSLLSVDPLRPAPEGTGAAYSFYEDDMINSNMMAGVGDTFVDYQVYPIAPVGVANVAAGGDCAYLSRYQQPQRQFSSMPSSCSSSAASGYNLVNDNNNNYNYDNNNSLCRISAIFKPVMRSGNGNNGNVGDLYFSKHQQQHRPRSENATGSIASNTNTTLVLQDEHHVACDRNEPTWPKRNRQNMSPLNGYHHIEGGCEGATVMEAADDERCGGVGRGRRMTATTSSAGVPMNGSDRAAFSSVRIVNGEAYAFTSDLTASDRRLIAAATDRQTIDRNCSYSDNNHTRNGGSGSGRALENLRDFGRSVRDRFVDIMRLNVPAAPEGSRTSVYIPSSEGTMLDSAIINGEGGTRPTLTIQVNRVDTNNQEQNDVVNNASSGVSIVNCYRESPKCAENPSDQECVVVPNKGQDGTEEGQFFPSEVNSGNLNPTVIDKNHINISANAEQMVHVSNTVVQKDPNLIEHSYSVKNSANNQTPAYPQTDIDRIEPAGNRTYTSTEAQTDDPHGNGGEIPGPYIHHSAIVSGGLAHTPPHPPPPTHPATLLLTPPGSEFSTREHRRRERRERRQARNRMQHVHPMDQPPPPPAMLRPPPIEIIPDILHSHLPPPYTTLPMGATVLPAPILPAVPVHHRGAADDCRYSFPIPIIRSSPSERSRKGCCGHWFAGPPLRALIAVVALGGVACALGGAALGATGLAGSPTSHLTAALLMIGVGVILVTVSGAAWRMTAPGAPPCLGLGSTVDLGRCSRRPCGRGGSTPHGLLYPEFQHRPPPPSYQASMQEYRLRLLLLDRDRQSGRMRSTASPPPTYRSNVGSLLRIPLTSRYNNSGSNNNPNGAGTTTTAGGGGGGASSGSTATSIFGGISGIISGAMGSSTNSVNVATQSSQPSAGNPPDITADPDPNGQPPPTYRTIDRRNSSTSVKSQPAPPATTSAGTATTTGESCGGSALINDDNNIASTAGPPVASARTPSIIKIDDAKSAPAAFGLAKTQPRSVPHCTDSHVSHKQRNSITREIIENDSNTGGENVANKDLVTIVTISGTVEQPKLNKSAPGVDATDCSSSTNPVPSSGSGTVAHL
ncbi:uncharacterized protein LOC129722666 isoform X2 [Wyeomyia smithii]|uniref:uncharacterized protein LOC129722666 isoform X2 n=1 Tax=Wyeomyia smithii TaxID=174621 RepID=UPI0024680ED1|nr:uncharacterized protein LOC129722666 isoform X2 [Wyeomyia smithii]